MIFTIEEARDILRIDGSDNDAMIFALLSAVPPYLEATTGYTAANGEYSPLAQAAGVKSKFVCKLLLGTCGAKGCLASLS